MTVLHRIVLGTFLFTMGSVFSECCFPICGEAFIGYDYFRSLPEGDWEGNTGAVAGVNFALPLPYFSGCGFAGQLGASYGVYDWNGRLSSPSGTQTKVQQQAFVTTGGSWRTGCDSGFNFGLVYDWMWNKNFGVFAVKTNIDQLRFQGGYLFCCQNELGLWGTLDLHWSRRSTQEIPLTYRAISQINLFWRHIFSNCAETVVWAGVPYKRSLMYSSGRAGRFIVGGSVKAPLTGRLGIEGHGTYMHPHSDSGALKQRNYAANICLQLTWALSSDPCCRDPYLPLANNSYFLVDTNVND